MNDKGKIINLINELLPSLTKSFVEMDKQGLDMLVRYLLNFALNSGYPDEKNKKLLEELNKIGYLISSITVNQQKKKKKKQDDSNSPVKLFLRQIFYETRNKH